MKLESYVITIRNNKDSIAAAQRCIQSGKKYGISIKHFWAYTPENTDLKKHFAHYNIPEINFHEKYSRLENCMAAFSSHHALWRMSKNEKKPILILEHDAVFVDALPKTVFGHVVSFGKPSYGKYNESANLGEQPLFSKKYFPGAHAYMVTPLGAAQLLKRAELDAAPTDVFLHTDKFDQVLREFYPWPIEAHDYFTTIQNENGCYAKHNFDENYQII